MHAHLVTAQPEEDVITAVLPMRNNQTPIIESPGAFQMVSTADLARWGDGSSDKPHDDVWTASTAHA